MPGAATTSLAASNATRTEHPAPAPGQKRPPGQVDRSRPPNEVLTLNALLRDNAQLRRQLHTALAENEAQRAEKSRETARFSERVTELRAELAGHEAAAAKLAGQLHTLQQNLPDLRERQILARRATDAEARANALSARLAEQESAAEHWRRRYLSAQKQLALAPEQIPGLPAADDEATALTGKCILCIGTHSSATEAYRGIVEGRGGRFLQQHAEQLENPKDIAAALSSADLVICQADSISRQDCRRLHAQCRQSDTPCIFLQEPGPAGFGRIVSAAFAPGERITLR